MARNALTLGALFSFLGQGFLVGIDLRYLLQARPHSTCISLILLAAHFGLAVICLALLAFALFSILLLIQPLH